MGRLPERPASPVLRPAQTTGNGLVIVSADTDFRRPLPSSPPRMPSWPAGQLPGQPLVVHSARASVQQRVGGGWVPTADSRGGAAPGAAPTRVLRPAGLC